MEFLILFHFNLKLKLRSHTGLVVITLDRAALST